MRMVASGLALGLLLAGCDGAPGIVADGTTGAAPMASGADGAASGEDGAGEDGAGVGVACPADADTPTRLGCAEDAIAASVADTPGAAAFATFLERLRERHQVDALSARLIEGNAAARLAADRRAAIAGRAGRAASSPAAASVRALPTELAREFAVAVDATCGGSARPSTCRTLMARAVSAYLHAVAPPDAPMPDANMPGAPMIDGRPVPDCASLDAGDAAAMFERDYPAALVDPARVDGVVIPKAAMSGLVAYIACAAARTNHEPFVIDQVRALFESRRHGGPALAALQAAAAGATPDAAAARMLRDVIRPQLGRDGNG